VDEIIGTGAIILLILYAILCSTSRSELNAEIGITVLLVILCLYFARGRNSIRYMFAFASIAQLRYLFWRFAKLGSDFVPMLFICADVYCTLALLAATYINWHREPDDRILEFEQTFASPQYCPLVDVYIATYRESVEVVRRTVAGALSISYKNKEIYLLDDGNREEMKALASEMGVNYLSRVKNENFKAGNINNALAQTKGELILQLDSDHICASTIIDYALPLFESDEKVAVVQYAQRAVNPSVLDRTLRYRGFATELAALFFVFLPTQALSHCVMWTGSGALLRRQALEQIGGIATGTIIEDFHTSVTLYDHGWKISYVPVPQVMVLNPETLQALLTQQKRWFTGMLQINFGKKYWLMRNLTIPQRVVAWSHFWIYLMCGPRLLWMLCPILFTVFQVMRVKVQAYEFLLVWLPVILLSYWGNFRLGGKNFSLVMAELFDTIRCPAMLGTMVKVFLQGLVQPFVSTPKGVVGASRTDWGVSAPYVLLFVVVLYGASMFTSAYIGHPDESILFLLISWYYVFLLACSICVALETPQPMVVHTVPTDLPVLMEIGAESLNGRLLRASEAGCSILVRLDKQLVPDQRFEITVMNETTNWSGRVRFIGQLKLDNGMKIVDLSFIPEDGIAGHFIDFIHLTISDNKVWQVPQNKNDVPALQNLIVTPFRVVAEALRKLAYCQTDFKTFFSRSIKTEKF
jgi:cellulose synthase (UDP-forming)